MTGLRSAGGFAGVNGSQAGADDQDLEAGLPAGNRTYIAISQDDPSALAPTAPPSQESLTSKALTVTTYALCAVTLGVTYAINSYIAAQASTARALAILAAICSSIVNIVLTAQDTKKDLALLLKSSLAFLRTFYLHDWTAINANNLKRWVANLTLLWLILQLTIPAATTLSNALEVASRQIGAKWIGTLLLYPVKWIQTFFITKDAFRLSHKALIQYFPSLKAEQAPDAVLDVGPEAAPDNLTPDLNKTLPFEIIRWFIAGLVVAADTLTTAPAINALYKNYKKDWVDQLMILTHVAGGKYLENFWFGLASNSIQVFLYMRLAKEFLDLFSQMLKHTFLNPRKFTWPTRVANFFKDALLLFYFYMTTFNVVEIARSGKIGHFKSPVLSALMLGSTKLVPASAFAINGASYPTLRKGLDAIRFNSPPKALKTIVSWGLCAVTLGVAYAVNSFLGAKHHYGILIAIIAAICSAIVNIVLTGEEIKEELSNLWTGGRDLIKRILNLEVTCYDLKNWFKNLALLYLLLQLSIPASAVMANGFQASCLSIGTTIALDLDRALTYPIKWVMAVFLTKDLFKKLRVWLGLAPAPAPSVLPIKLSIEIDRCSEAARWILSGILTISLVLGTAPSITMLYKNNPLDWMDKMMVLPYLFKDILLRPGMAIAISAIQGPLYARLMKNALVYFGDMAKQTFLNPWGLSKLQRFFNLIKDVTLLGYFFMTIFNIMQVAKTSGSSESFGLIPAIVMRIATDLLIGFAYVCNAATYPVLRAGSDKVFQAAAEKFCCQKKQAGDFERGLATNSSGSGSGSSATVTTALLGEQRRRATSDAVSTGSMPGVPKLPLTVLNT